METMIKFNNVTKRYLANKEALKDISLEVKKGSIVGLLGPNGSGKSTFLKLCCGLIRPSMGEVLVLGQKITPALKEDIAFVPELDYLYDWMTVKETIKFTSKFYRDFDLDKAEEIRKFVGIPENDKVKALSKGQRARLKLILAMARKAKLVLLDEPLGGIDMISREKIIKSIISTFREEEQTIVISTHEIKEVEGVFDHVIMLSKGNIILSGDTEEICSERRQHISEIYQEVYSCEEIC